MDDINTVGPMGDPSADPVLGGTEGMYPHEVEIARIKTWPFESMADLRALMEYVKARWRWPDWGWEESDVDDREFMFRGHEYRVSTGGWSGNEDLVAALEANMMWSMIVPWQWRRGGHYVWRIPDDPS